MLQFTVLASERKNDDNKNDIDIVNSDGKENIKNEDDNDDKRIRIGFS